MFDDAALVLEEIAPEDKNRNEVLGARVNLYMVAKKWDMAVSVASHLVKVEPEEAGWWINLAYATRRAAEVHIEEDSRRYPILSRVAEVAAKEQLRLNIVAGLCRQCSNCRVFKKPSVG